MIEPKRVKILVVDDHPFLREGLADAIDCQVDMVLVGEARDGTEAIAMFRKHRPDVTLMDLQMPNMSGIDAIIAIRAEYPDARIIVLSAYKKDIQAFRAFRAGAVGYVLKNMMRKDLLETIRVVQSGRKRIPPEIAQELGQYAVEDALTEREIEVLRLIAIGTSNKIIGGNLGVSENTVKTHVQSILTKLGAKDRTHAVTIAIRRGYIESE